MTSSPWSIVARNLPEHADNPIHTDVGAQAAGFERALVAGVTTYAYALHPIIEHFGVSWVMHGSAEVRLKSPVFDRDVIRFPVTTTPGGISVSAVVDRTDQPLIVVSASPTRAAVAANRPGESVESMVVELVDEFGSTYAARAGDDLTICQERGIVHPAVWPALANYVFHRRLARGPWIHTRSRVRHHATAPEGAAARIDTTVVERFVRHGERVIADVTITVDDIVVATLEHEAIIEVSPAL
jgi:MaoC like domain